MRRGPLLLFVVLLGACPDTTGPAPEPEGFVVGPSPYVEDFETAAENMDPAVRDQGVGIPEGDLAGTFALRTVSATLVDTVINGQHRGGGVNFRLVTRTFDEETRDYTQRSVLCDGFNFEVAGVITETLPGAYRKVPASENETVRADMEGGIYLSFGHVQLWGIQGLEDPATSPLPTTIEEADAPPHKDHIYDMDEDGERGITLHIEGQLGAGEFVGDVYAIQRKTVGLQGVTVSKDHAFGFVTTGYESLPLGADPDILSSIYQGSADPHPDANESWFEEVRIADDADCDDVMAFADDGGFVEDAAPWISE